MNFRIAFLGTTSIVLASTIINAQTINSSNDLQLCRPHTKNMLQNVTQRMVYFYAPKCNKSKPIVILKQPISNMINTTSVYFGSDGKTYVQHRGTKLKAD